jgi:hypothetical protein
MDNNEQKRIPRKILKEMISSGYLFLKGNYEISKLGTQEFESNEGSVWVMESNLIQRILNKNENSKFSYR